MINYIAYTVLWITCVIIYYILFKIWLEYYKLEKNAWIAYIIFMILFFVLIYWIYLVLDYYLNLSQYFNFNFNLQV